MTTMIETLAADGPFPDHADALQTFGRLVGEWEFDVANYGEDGEVAERGSGTWVWGWILDGRAVQDVWTVPGREHGTTVRFYDPKLDAWRVVWNGPVAGRQDVFVARRAGEDGIVMDGDGVQWIFSEITEHSFRWRAEIEGRLVQEMRVRRRG